MRAIINPLFLLCDVIVTCWLAGYSAFAYSTFVSTLRFLSGETVYFCKCFHYCPVKVDK